MSQETINLIITSSVNIFTLICGAFIGIIASILTVIITHRYQKERDKQTRKWELEDRKRENTEKELNKIAEWLNTCFLHNWKLGLIINMLISGAFSPNQILEKSVEVAKEFENYETGTELLLKPIAGIDKELSNKMHEFTTLRVKGLEYVNGIVKKLEAGTPLPDKTEIEKFYSDFSVESVNIYSYLYKRLVEIRDSLYKD